jgi:hypothetical protein
MNKAIIMAREQIEAEEDKRAFFILTKISIEATIDQFSDEKENLELKEYLNTEEGIKLVEECRDKSDEEFTKRIDKEVSFSEKIREIVRLGMLDRIARKIIDE